MEGTYYSLRLSSTRKSKLRDIKYMYKISIGHTFILVTNEVTNYFVTTPLQRKT